MPGPFRSGPLTPRRISGIRLPPISPITASQCSIGSRRRDIAHLAVHFDLDVLDPAHFSPLLFNKPGVPADAFDGMVQGSMRLVQVTRLLKDAATAADMVGLAVAQHLPWDMLRPC